MSDGQAINSGAWYSVGKIHLTPGMWIVSGNCSIWSEQSVTVSIYQRIINGDASIQYAADAIYTGLRNTQSIGFVKINIDQDIFLQVQASGNAKVYTNGMSAIRIK